MLYYILAFVIALAATALLMPLAIKYAEKIDFVEKPGNQARKIAKDPKPYLGSVPMFIVFWIVYLIFSLITGNLNTKIIPTFVGSVIIMVIGLIDDWYKVTGRDFKALPKLIIQLSACMIIFFSGVKFSGIYLQPIDKYISFPIWIQFILTITWLFGICTVINFTDGIDALAGSISCISATTLFIILKLQGQNNFAMLSIIIVAVCLGYLKYNRYPSKILMGDSGATFLGFMLGVISLGGTLKQATAISVFVPILVFGIPIFDNIRVVLERIKEKKHIYVGDRKQIHFRLIDKGLTQVYTVAFLCLISTCLSLISIIIVLLE